jgi:hypothetical protein
LTNPPEILLFGDPLAKITFTFGGMTSQASRRGFAHLWEFQRRISITKPGAWFRMIQPAFNTDVPASAGTHDKFDVWDYEIVGWDNWYTESKLARMVGLADWVRNPTQGDFGWHHHAISRGLPEDMYGDLVPAQLFDYTRHALALSGRHDPGGDPQCRDGHTIEPIFNYQAWKARYTMLDPDDKTWLKNTIASETKDAVKALFDDAATVGKISNAVLTENVYTRKNGDKVNLRTAMRELYGDAAEPGEK